MEYLVATIVIMLFCITALAQDRSSESAIIISREKPKPEQPGKKHERHIIRHSLNPTSAGLPNFTGMPRVELIPVTGGRAVSHYLPTWYGIAGVHMSPGHNNFQVLAGADRWTKISRYMALGLLFKPVKFIWQSILFCHEKITT